MGFALWVYASGRGTQPREDSWRESASGYCRARLPVLPGMEFSLNYSAWEKGQKGVSQAGSVHTLGGDCDLLNS